MAVLSFRFDCLELTTKGGLTATGSGNEEPQWQDSLPAVERITDAAAGTVAASPASKPVVIK
jgi:hypothetical protein